MTFTIHQHSDDIVVILDGDEYMRVSRKFNWWGTLRSEFNMDGQAVLTSTYDNSLFRKRLFIQDQRLPQHIYLEKSRDKYSLRVGRHVLTKTRHVLKNPILEIFVDGQLASQIMTDLSLKIGGRIVYEMVITNWSVGELYLLIFFLIDLAPTLS